MPWWSAYQPKESVIHKANPEIKFAWGWCVFFASILFWNPVIPFFFFLIGLPILFMGKITKITFKRFAVFLPPTIVMFIFQTFFASYAPTILGYVTLGSLSWPIRYEGFYKSLWFLTVWLASFVWVGGLVIMSTHPGDIFLVLRKLKIPYIVCFIVMVTLQMVPIMKRDLDLIVEAQRSRGLVIGRNPLRIIAIAIPLMVTSMERVYKMSWSLEARAFASKGKKTSFRQIYMTRIDKILTLLAFVFLAAMITIRIKLGPLYIPPNIFLNFISFNIIK